MPVLPPPPLLGAVRDPHSDPRLSVVSRSMYFHVHVVSILVALALKPKHKSRKDSSSSSLSSMCPLQSQPVHSNNNDDKIA